jgi:DNA-binding winged helix-turn-helix (wHTH) protein
MKSAIDSALRSPGAKLYLKELELDLGARSLRHGQNVVALRAKTFDLLMYLVDRRDRIVSKEELLRELWPDTAVTPDALVQSVLDLRRSLGDTARNPQYIKTVSKVGYQFIAEVSNTPPSTGRADLASEPEWIRTPRRHWIAIAGVLAVAIVAAVTLSLVRARSRLQSADPEQFEVAWWKLNEGSGSQIRDSVHGLSAKLPPGVSWTQGVSGSALLFTGRELVVRGLDPGVLPKGDSPRTLTAWIKTKSTSADSTEIFTAGDPQPDSASAFTLSLHLRGAADFANLRHFEVVGKERIDDDRWHQVTGVFEGRGSRRMRLFVDGAEQASATLPVLSHNLESQWAIGTGFSGGTTFHGTIDDVRVFERALRPDEIRSLYGCLTAAGDIDMQDRGAYQLVTVFGDRVEMLPRRPGENSAGVRNTANDFAGVAIARREPDCALRSIHGADIGQDMNIEAELLVPPGPGGTVTDGGPFFRSRRANPGDGIIGGTSAGFWIHLDSTGQVRVRRLYPNAIIAFSETPTEFDPKSFHRLEAAVHGETLQVALDRRLIAFEADGVRTTLLSIAPLWEGASPKGTNGGSAGIAFSSSRNRGLAGGQEARNIRVKPYHPLSTANLTTLSP